jgi:hypothetical protein
MISDFIVFKLLTFVLIRLVHGEVHLLVYIVCGYKIVSDCGVRPYPTLQNTMRDDTLLTH